MRCQSPQFVPRSFVSLLEETLMRRDFDAAGFSFGGCGKAGGDN